MSPDARKVLLQLAEGFPREAWPYRQMTALVMMLLREYSREEALVVLETITTAVRSDLVEAQLSARGSSPNS